MEDSVDSIVRASEVPLDFPSGYTYKVRDGKILVKEITEEQSTKWYPIGILLHTRKWLNDFKMSSKSSWTIARTYVTSGDRVKFKEEWKCHSNVQSRFKGTSRKMNKISKNLNCPARIRCTVFRTMKKSRSKLCLDPDYPCHLEVCVQHNHLLETAAVVRFNRVSQETREKLLNLFMSGHTAATAREQLKLELYLDDIDAYYKEAADNSVIPTLATVQYIFNKNFKGTYGARSGDEMDKALNDLLQKYSEETPDGSAVMGFVGDHKYVAICTPIMKRAHQLLPQAAELVLVDCSGNMDKDNHRVYMFVTPGPPGGVPVGCIITDVEKKEVFEAGLDALKKILPDNCFFGKTWPTVIMTDDDLKERDPLHVAWLLAVLLLCQFHILKAHWNWLLQAKHKIDKYDRQGMYFGFKRLVHASTPHELEEDYNKHISEYGEKYPKYVDHLTKIYERRKEWADAYRKDLPLRGNNTTNYVETVFRILKDCVLERVKALNLTHLVDFILMRYEGYMQRRLIDFSHDRYCKSMIKKYLPRSEKKIDVSTIQKSQEDPTCFMVPSTSSPGILHLVDAQHGFCGCDAGRGGRICSHLSAVMQNFCIHDQMFTISPEMKRTVFEVATGKPPPATWLLPLNTQPDECEIPVDTNMMNVTSNTQSTSAEESVLLPSQEISSPETLTENEENDLQDFFLRITDCVKTNPEVFCPAVKKFLQNVKQYVKTDSSLVSALHTFGKYSGLASVASVKSRKGQMIGVQPTSVARRKQPVGGKRSIGGGRPPGQPKRPAELEQHDYTTFGALPANKRRASHNLQLCVERNKGVPTKRSAAD